MKYIKVILALTVSSLLVTVAQSQEIGFSYQAVILNPSTLVLPGNNVSSSVLSDSDVSLRFSIEANSVIEFQEIHYIRTDAYGMINLFIGKGEATLGLIEDVIWDGHEKNLRIEIDFTATSLEFELLNTQRLTYTPHPMSIEDYSLIEAIDVLIEQNASISNLSDIALQEEIDQNESTSNLSDIAIQATIDQNELESNIADELIQANVDQNEFDSDLADIEIQLEIDQNAAASEASDIAIQIVIDENQAESTASDAVLNTMIENNSAADEAESFAGLEMDSTLQSSLIQLATISENADAVIQADVDQNEADSDALDLQLEADLTANYAADSEESFEGDAKDQIIQLDVDHNEADSDATDTAIQSDVDQNETDSDAADSAIQDDVDQNELNSDAADSDIQDDVNQNELNSDAADSDIQDDVDQNESDSDAADSDIQTDVDQNEADSDSTDIAIQADVDQNEAVSDAADTQLGINISVNADLDLAESIAGDEKDLVIQDDVDQNESVSDAADTQLGINISVNADLDLAESIAGDVKDLVVHETLDFFDESESDDTTIELEDPYAKLEITNLNVTGTIIGHTLRSSNPGTQSQQYVVLGGGDDSNQTHRESYPLQIHGVNQGLWISIDAHENTSSFGAGIPGTGEPSAPPAEAQNYITFSANHSDPESEDSNDNQHIWGRIDGTGPWTSFIQIVWNDLTSFFTLASALEASDTELPSIIDLVVDDRVIDSSDYGKTKLQIKVKTNDNEFIEQISSSRSDGDFGPLSVQESESGGDDYRHVLIDMNEFPGKYRIEIPEDSKDLDEGLQIRYRINSDNVCGWFPKESDDSDCNGPGLGDDASERFNLRWRPNKVGFLLKSVGGQTVFNANCSGNSCSEYPQDRFFAVFKENKNYNISDETTYPSGSFTDSGISDDDECDDCIVNTSAVGSEYTYDYVSEDNGIVYSYYAGFNLDDYSGEDGEITQSSSVASTNQIEDFVASVNTQYTNFVGAWAETQMLIDILQNLIDIVVSLFPPGVPWDFFDVLDAASELAMSISDVALYVYSGQKTTGIQFTSRGADYAEYVEKAIPEEHLIFGEVVGIVDGKGSKTFVDSEHFLVVSKAPIVLGNSDLEDPEISSVKLAFLGQVPVRVKGSVFAGDYVIASGLGDGFAYAKSPSEIELFEYDRVVGISWENGSDADQKSGVRGHYRLINTAIGLDNNNLTEELTHMEAELTNLKEQLNIMGAALEKLNSAFVYTPLEVENDMNQSIGTMDEMMAGMSNQLIDSYDRDFLNASMQVFNNSEHPREELSRVIEEMMLDKYGFDIVNDYPWISRIIKDPEFAQYVRNVCEHQIKTIHEIAKAHDEKKGTSSSENLPVDSKKGERESKTKSIMQKQQ